MSLRARLVAVMCVVAAVALTFAGIATYRTFRSSQLSEIDDTLQRLHEPIEGAITPADDDEEAEIEIEALAPGMFVAVVTSDGTQLTIPARVPGHTSLTVDVSDLSTPFPAGTVDRPVFTTRDAVESDAELRLRVSRLSDGSMLVLGLSLEQVDESQRHLIVIELIVAAIALVLSALIGWILVRAGLRPLRNVEAAARRVATEGDLEQAIPESDGPREVANVASAMNTMLGTIRESFAERDAQTSALEASEQRMRQFVADVSHELRTPIAAVAAYSELVDRGARNHPDDLDRALRGIGSETARMRELVEELLLLAQLDEGRPLLRQTVDLNDVVLSAVRTARAVGPDHPISMQVSDIVVVDGDASRLRRVIDNLLANARTHTPPETHIDVTITAHDGTGTVVIADNGPGMAPEHAVHIFDRFSRADPSRSRGSGGAGLGMAIVKAIVEAHGGRVEVTTAPGHGFAVTITLPLAGDRRDPPPASPEVPAETPSRRAHASTSRTTARSS